MSYNIEEIDLLGLRASKTFQSTSNTKYKTIKSYKNIIVSVHQFLKNLLVNTFLPINYEKSVRAEYLEYQFYDSLQGLCSYIRGVITIRAVLIGAGVGDSNKTGTSAALAWAFKDGIGMIGTLLLAYTSSRSFEVYVKEWRLLADLLNNVALTIDLATHFLPFYTKNEIHYALFLAISSLFKCACGLIAGATKVRISSHFAKEGCLADVTAKESSQETAVALVGLIIGGIIAKVFGDSDFDNIFIFFVLSILHTWANFLLMKTLVFDTMNPQRCWLITKAMIENKNLHVLPPLEIKKKETLFLPFYLSYFGPILGCSVHVILNTLDHIKNNTQAIKARSSTKKILEISWKNLTDSFKEEHFIIGIDNNERVVICISHTANNDENILIKAYMMGCYLHQTWYQQKTKQKLTKKARIANLYSLLINTDAKKAINWYNQLMSSVQKVGLNKYFKSTAALFSDWDISRTNLGEGSLRYKNKIMRSSMLPNPATQANSNLESKNSQSKSVSFADKLENNENIGSNRNISFSDLPETPDIKRVSENTEDSPSVVAESTVTDLLLTYTGTNLVLDLFVPSSPSAKKDDNTWRDSANVEESFSKGEEKLN